MTFTDSSLFGFFLALALTLAITPGIRWLALKAGAIDHPEARRIHSIPTPRWGGLAVYISVMVTLFVVCALSRGFRESFARQATQVACLATGTTLLLSIGLIDDCRSVRPGAKLVAEIVAAATMALAGCRIESAFGVHLGFLSIPATVLWIVAFINAFNMIDGLDGLAGGIAVMISAMLILLLMRGGNLAETIVLAAVCGALLGFLRYNFRSATIFLGDSGSLWIGFAIAAASVTTSIKAEATTTLLVPLLTLGVPLAELLLTMMRRLLKVVHVDAASEWDRFTFHISGKAALFSPDRDHLHHRLLALGLSQGEVLWLMYVACLIVNLVAFGLIIENGSYTIPLFTIIVVAAIVCVRLLRYDELQPIRRGLFLPLFPLSKLAHRQLQLTIDWMLAAASLLLVYSFRGGTSNQSISWLLLVGQATIIATMQTGLLGLGGLYKCSYPFVGLDDVVGFLRSCCLVALGSWIFMLSVDSRILATYELTLLDLYLLGSALIAYRIAFPVLRHIFDSTNNARQRVLIYGTGNAGLVSLNTIRRNPSLNMVVVGFIDDDTRQEELRGLPILRSSVVEASKGQFDEIVVAAGIADEALTWFGRRGDLNGIRLKRLVIDCIEYGFDEGIAVNGDGRVSQFGSRQAI